MEVNNAVAWHRLYNVEMKHARGVEDLRSTMEKIRLLERDNLRQSANVDIHVTPERGFYIVASGVEYGAEAVALERLAPFKMKGVPYIRVAGSYGRSFRLNAGQVDLPALRYMLENYAEWNRRDIAARNRLQMYG